MRLSSLYLCDVSFLDIRGHYPTLSNHTKLSGNICNVYRFSLFHIISIYLSTCLTISISTYRYTDLSIYLSTYLSMYLSFFLSIYSKYLQYLSSYLCVKYTRLFLSGSFPCTLLICVFHVDTHETRGIPTQLCFFC